MNTKLSFCLRIIVITFLPLLAFFSCNDNQQKTDYNVLVDSLKQSEGGVYLDQPELNRFLYAERNDTTIDENWFMGVLHVIDTKQNTELAIRVNGNDYPKYLLRGESDSIVCLISIGGSGGFCCFSRINLNEMRETLYKSLNSRFFTLDSITDKGYHGKMFYRWQDLDRNPGEDSISSVVIDFMGNEYPVSIDGVEECVSVNVDSCQGVKFIVYHPNYSCVRLVCGDIPTGNDKKQIFCAAAAFTGVGYENGFDHKLIAGNHTSDGVYYKGYKCERNSGAFVFYDGKHKFLYKEYAAEMEKSANHHGMGFAQEMMIHEGSRVATYRKDDNMNVFRALCEKDGQVCVVESESVVKFGDFINALKAYGISEALYLDMGGWAYSWYRSANGKTVHTHEYGRDVLTNAIVFEK